MSTKQGKRTVVGVVAALAIVAAGCGSTDSADSGAKETPGNGSTGSVEVGLVNQTEAPAAKDGGTLTFSEGTPTLALDPIKQQSAGATGNIPLGAIYDVLMRYDVETGAFEPQLAESIESNDDFTTWTLTLRDGVSFTDGTPLDAEAVVAHFERYSGAPAATFSTIAETITAVAPDATTVTFDLEEPWAAFPSLLASNAGMVVSPTAVEDSGEDYPNKPVGAGPFKLESFAPGEKIELVRNDDYWGERPHLDSVVVTSVADPAATIDRLETGEVKMAFVTDAAQAVRAEKAGFPGYVAMSGAQGWLLNTREGAPTHDVRVRQAIAHAIDPDMLNEKVDDGVGVYGSNLIWAGSRWATKTPGPEYDVEKAKALVAEVKAEGSWDGSIELLSPQTRNPATALTTQAMLNAVGFKAEVVPTQSINELVQKVVVDNNFDMAFFGISLWDSDPWVQLRAGITLKSSGYQSDEFTKVVADLGAAGTDAEKQDAFEAIQKRFAEDVPFVVTSGKPMATMWAKDVHGVVPTSQATVLLDKASLSGS